MNKTRILNVRVVGFSAPERQMLNSIFLLSVAPARQIISGTGISGGREVSNAHTRDGRRRHVRRAP